MGTLLIPFLSVPSAAAQPNIQTSFFDVEPITTVHKGLNQKWNNPFELNILGFVAVKRNRNCLW